MKNDFIEVKTQERQMPQGRLMPNLWDYKPEMWANNTLSNIWGEGKGKAALGPSWPTLPEFIPVSVA